MTKVAKGLVLDKLYFDHMIMFSWINVTHIIVISDLKKMTRNEIFRLNARLNLNP